MAKRQSFRSVAEFMTAHNYTDADLARLLDTDQSRANRLRHGLRFKALRMPLKVSRLCHVPIENLAPEKLA